MFCFRYTELNPVMCICCTMCALLLFALDAGRSCDRPPRHKLFLVFLCLKANTETVPDIHSCHYMLLMKPSRLKFCINNFNILYTCKITNATG